MRATAGTQDLTALVERVFGHTPQVTGVDRLRGGTRKGDFPDRAFIQQLAEGNLQAALALLPEETTHA